MSPPNLLFRLAGSLVLLALLGLAAGCAHGRLWGVKHGGQSPRFGADVTIPLGK